MISPATVWLRCRVAVIPLCAALVCYLPALAQALPAGKQQEVGALTKQIAVNGNDYSLYAKRGLIYLRAKSFQNADVDFQKGLSFNSKWQEGLLLHADCLAGMGHYKQAISAVDEAEMIGPLTAQKLQWRGDLFMRLKEYKPAIVNFSQAIVSGGQLPHNSGGKLVIAEEKAAVGGCLSFSIEASSYFFAIS